MSNAQAVQMVLDILRGKLGLGEDPHRKNYNEIVQWYHDNVDSKLGDGPWCEMTMTYAFWNAGFKAMKKGRAYTIYAIKDAIAGVNGASWHYGTKGLLAGDEVYFDWNGRKGNYKDVDHVGMVEKVNANGTFYTLEGNTSDKLLRRLRSSKYVVGYIRYDWSKAVITKPRVPAKKPTTGDRQQVRRIQKVLDVPTTGTWDTTTDRLYRRLRLAALVHLGYPKKLKKAIDIRATQQLVGTKIDGVWGPISQAHLLTKVKQLQSALSVQNDGQWGPKSENAWLKVRKTNKQ